jgi:uncharacterized protein (TIGR04141 family)
VARKPGPAVRSSLYRLTGLTSLRDGIRDKYFTDPYDFTAIRSEVGDRVALVVSGTMETVRVKWAPTLEALAGHPVSLGNRTAAAVLLIRQHNDAEVAWAITYGMGFQLLDQNHVDAGFGQRIAIRSATDGVLSSVTRTTLDAKARVDRLSIPSGDHLRNFGVGDFGELVTRLVAKARIGGLTDPNETITVRGADALSLPLARTPTELLSDLDLLNQLLAEPVAAGLEMLEQLTVVKRQSRLARLLDAALDHALGDPGAHRLGVAWPHEQADETGPVNAFRIFGNHPNSGPFDDVPALSDILATLEHTSPGDRVERLRCVKIQLLRDASGETPEAASPAIPALRWLAFETDHENRRYFLHNGSWYLMDQDYAAKLRQQTAQILERDPGLTMPDWTPDLTEEKDYNQKAAQQLGGLVLDRRRIQTPLQL